MTLKEFLYQEAEGVSKREKTATCQQCGREFKFVDVPFLSDPNTCLECVFKKEEADNDKIRDNPEGR